MGQNKITFICFNINDGTRGEKHRIDMSMQSLLEQKKKNYEIIFIDCSVIEKPIILSESPLLKRISLPLNEKSFYPAYIRNHGALQATTEYVCHINSDCIYAPNFSEKLEACLNGGTLAMCERKNTTIKQSGEIKSLAQAKEIAKGIKKTAGKYCCGDCQAIQRKKFIKNGGYYDLIKDEKLKSGKSQCSEDMWLLNNQSKFKVKEHYMTGTWILHMGHPWQRKMKAAITGRKPSQ